MYVRLVWLLYPKTFGASSMQRACPAQRDILIFTFMFHLSNSGRSDPQLLQLLDAAFG
jgi:hypothetical protein